MACEGGESVISRVVRIVDAFDRESQSLPLGKLANRAGLPLTTTHRLVSEMLRHGLLERDADKDISIGVRLWEISSKGSRVLTLRETALPFIEDLQANLKQHVNLAVMDRHSVLFIERLAPEGSTLEAARMGERWVLHASSPGLVLLAYSPPDYQNWYLARPLTKVTAETVTDPESLRRTLADVRQQRYAFVPGIGMKDWTGTAVPIIGSSDEVVGALSVIYRRGEEQPQVAIPALQIAASGISRALGGTGLTGKPKTPGK